MSDKSATREKILSMTPEQAAFLLHIQLPIIRKESDITSRVIKAVPVAKESFIEGLGDIACGVGYYNTTSSAQASGGLSRVEREQHACAVVMGLSRPGALYNTCVRTLDKTLSELDQAQQISRKRNFCARAGLAPGTPSFAACTAVSSASATLLKGSPDDTPATELSDMDLNPFSQESIATALTV